MKQGSKDRWLERHNYDPQSGDWDTTFYSMSWNFSIKKSLGSPLPLYSPVYILFQIKSLCPMHGELAQYITFLLPWYTWSTVISFGESSRYLLKLMKRTVAFQSFFVNHILIKFLCMRGSRGGGGSMGIIRSQPNYS